MYIRHGEYIVPLKLSEIVMLRHEIAIIVTVLKLNTASQLYCSR